MQAVPCPTCGAPLAVTLASLRGVRCRACGFEGPPPAAAEARLRAAESELGRLDVRVRQFDASARTAIVRALRAGWGVLAALTLGALPFVGLAVFGARKAFEHDGPVANRVSGAIFIAVPALIYCTVGCILHATVVGARRQLLAACAAVPPARPGEPAACAVCGAPLAARGVDPIARCAHCAADNVVHPKAMARAASEKGLDHDALTAEIRRRSTVIGASARRAALASGALVFATPFAGFASVLGVLLLAKALEPLVALAPSPLARYAFVETKRGRCVGLISRSSGETEAYFGSNDRLPNPSTLDEGDAAALELFPATALVGRRIHLANGAEGVVTKALGAPLTNREQLVLESGAHGDAAGSCDAPAR